MHIRGAHALTNSKEGNVCRCVCVCGGDKYTFWKYFSGSLMCPAPLPFHSARGVFPCGEVGPGWGVGSGRWRAPQWTVIQRCPGTEQSHMVRRSERSSWDTEPMATKMEVRINSLVVLCGCLCLALTGECPGGSVYYNFHLTQRKDMHVDVWVVVFL